MKYISEQKFRIRDCPDIVNSVFSTQGTIFEMLPFNLTIKYYYSLKNPY